MRLEGLSHVHQAQTLSVGPDPLPMKLLGPKMNPTISDTTFTGNEIKYRQFSGLTVAEAPRLSYPGNHQTLAPISEPSTWDTSAELYLLPPHMQGVYEPTDPDNTFALKGIRHLRVAERTRVEIPGSPYVRNHMALASIGGLSTWGPHAELFSPPSNGQDALGYFRAGRIKQRQVNSGTQTDTGSSPMTLWQQTEQRTSDGVGPQDVELGPNPVMFARLLAPRGQDLTEPMATYAPRRGVHVTKTLKTAAVHDESHSQRRPDGSGIN
jgi:hypothetical protein